MSLLVTDVTVGDRPGRAVSVVDGRIAWLGAAAAAPSADRVVAGEGALLTPAFVDAHVHATATGLALTGLDLHSSSSLAAVLASLRAHAEASPGGVLLGNMLGDMFGGDDKSGAAQAAEAAKPGEAAAGEAKPAEQAQAEDPFANVEETKYDENDSIFGGMFGGGGDDGGYDI